MTPEQIEQMRADMEAGTGGAMSSAPSSDSLNHAVKVHGPKAVAADIRRRARVPQLEAEVLRLREALERVETASRHFANPQENMSCESIQYAHETTARLVADALKGGE
jgi:hypothetical protein